MLSYPVVAALLTASLLVLSASPSCGADERPVAAALHASNRTSGPSAVFLATRPAILVTVDGPPRYTLVKGADPLLWRVTNTGVLLLKNARGRHFLHLYDGFLESDSLDGPWRLAEKAPPGAALAVRAARASGITNLLEGTPDPRTRKRPSLGKSVVPPVYLSTVPAVVVVTDGTPDFISIEGTSLFYARNTPADLFWHQGDGILYILAAGRWYRAGAYQGPWETVTEEGLPSDFGEIPETSPKRRVKGALPFRRDQAGTADPGRSWLAGLLGGRGFRTVPAGLASAVTASSSRQWCERPR